MKPGAESGERGAGSRKLRAEGKERVAGNRPHWTTDRGGRTVAIAKWPGGRDAAVVLGVVLATMLLPAVAWAQQGRVQVKEGNKLYAEGRFPEAHEKYLDALRDAPDSPLIRFNDGNALYREEEYQRALEAYREAAESGDPGLASQGWYNLGNTLYRQQQLQDALEAYKQSLRADPSDVDAKHNLELVLKQLQKQQQQQQQQQQGQEGQQKQQPAQQQQQGQQQQQREQQEQQGQQQEQQGGEEQQGQQQPNQQSPQPQPGQMSREEAERLLQAIQEDPGKIQRQRTPSASRKRPRKDW